MYEDNEALIREWVERVWNQKDSDFIAELLTPDTLAHGMGPNGTDLVGAAAFQHAHALFCEAIPDLHITIDTMVVSGDKVACHLTCRGTHKGDSFGFPGTGKTVTFPAMTIARIENGKIVEGWNVIDLLSVFSQTGAMKVTASLP